MTFEDFTSNSKVVFERFPNEQVWRQGGFRPNRQLQKPEAGYCIVFRYDVKTTGLIANFMRAVYTVFPPLVEYNEQSLHTTIGVFEKGDLESFAPRSAVLKLLGQSVTTGLRDSPGKPAITFEKWLYNDEALLISGYPNQDLWRLSQNIGDACQKNGVPLERGRIFHITTARFITGVTCPVFEQFLLLMESAPLIGSTHPAAIDVATWRCDGLRFDMITHQRYSL